MPGLMLIYAIHLHEMYGVHRYETSTELLLPLCFMKRPIPSSLALISDENTMAGGSFYRCYRMATEMYIPGPQLEGLMMVGTVAVTSMQCSDI